MKHERMKWTTVAAIALALSINVVWAGTVGPTAAPKKLLEGPFHTPKDKVSYSLGVEVIRNFQRQGADVDVDELIKGIRDAAAGGPLTFTEDDMRRTLDQFGSELRGRQAQARLALALDNKKAGEEFLAANKTRDGVVALPSGLQYKVLREGKGERPTDASTVEYHYRATTIDGTEFENSYIAGPVTLVLADRTIIAGLREGLKLMAVGSKWQLFIPHNLAYLGQGSGRVGPNTTLIYEVELLAVK